MTFADLSQLFWLKKEVEQDTQRLTCLRLENREESSNQLEEMIREKKSRCIAERQRLEEYISSIPDSLTRMIFTYRFIDGLSWFKVSHKLGHGTTADGVRMIARRYLKNHHEK